MLSIALDNVEALPHPRRTVGVPPQHRRPSEHGVEGGTQLVAHCRQELVLCAVGLLELTAQGFRVPQGGAREFAPGASRRQPRGDPNEKVPSGERLDDVVVGTRVQSLRSGLLSCAGGQEHHRDLPQCCVATKSAKEGKPVEARHHDVSEDEIGVAAHNGFESRLAIPDGLHPSVLGADAPGTRACRRCRQQVEGAPGAWRCPPSRPRAAGEARRTSQPRKAPPARIPMRHATRRPESARTEHDLAGAPIPAESPRGTSCPDPHDSPRRLRRHASARARAPRQARSRSLLGFAPGSLDAMEAFEEVQILLATLPVSRTISADRGFQSHLHGDGSLNVYLKAFERRFRTIFSHMSGST